MKLRELMSGIDVLAQIDEELEVSSLAMHPNNIRPGAIFGKLGLKWMPTSSENAALSAGASGVLVGTDDADAQSEPSACRIIVQCPQQAYALMAANFFENAHDALALYGVTGTKGKTTVCHLIHDVLRYAGVRIGMISSLIRKSPEGHRPSSNTTPEPFELHGLLRHMLGNGATKVVLEASSIGIAENRLHGLKFSGVVFTNLGSDHLEYHGGWEAYAAAKARLFIDSSLQTPDCVIVLNIDDPIGREIRKMVRGRVITYGLDNGDIRPDEYRFTPHGMSLSLCGRELLTPLLGKHNLYNLLGAFALTQELVGVDVAIEGLRHANRIRTT